MKKQDPIFNPTAEQIAAWKAEYSKVFALEVSKETMSLDPHLLVAELDQQDRLTGYIHQPDNKVLNFAMQRLPNMQDAGKIIIKNCWLGGDEEILKEDSYLNSAALQVIELIQIRQGRLKEV